jgi:hypothetical protein
LDFFNDRIKNKELYKNEWLEEVTSKNIKMKNTSFYKDVVNG